MYKKTTWATALAALLILTNTAIVVTPSRSHAAEQVDATVENGKKLFETIAGVGCIACHGMFGEGQNGPYNRGVNETTVRAAIEKIPAMQFIREQATETDIKQIAAYTEWMGQHALQKALLKRGRFIPETISVQPGTPIQLVIENTGSEPSTVRSDELGTVTVPPRENASLVWTAPQTEGKFTVACSDCKIKDGLLTIEVTKTAKPYTPPPQPKIAPKL